MNACECCQKYGATHNRQPCVVCGHCANSDTTARDAFEDTVKRAGRVLSTELQAADGKAERRAAWVRYGDAVAAAGEAYRAATGRAR